MPVFTHFLHAATFENVRLKEWLPTGNVTDVLHYFLHTIVMLFKNKNRNKSEFNQGNYGDLKVR